MHRMLIAVALVLAMFGASSALAKPTVQPAGKARIAAAAKPTADMKREARAQFEKRQKWLRSPKAKRERTRSRHRFSNQTARTAARTTKRVFGEQAVAPTWDPPALDVKKYLTPSVARIHPEGTPPDTRALVDSSVPLITEDKVPTDLALDAEVDGSYTATNPIVDVTLPEVVTEGLQIDGKSQTTITPEGLAASAIKVGERVMYANAARDTDWLAAPLPTGIRLEAILRSSDSPTRLDVALDVKDAAPLVQIAADGSVAVTGDAGKKLLSITPPVARDAQNSPVPAHYETSGSDLTIVVDHTASSYAYPILLDPDFNDEWWASNGQAGVGWVYGQFSPNFGSAETGAWGNGKYIASAGPHNALDWAWWHYTAPGNSSEISQAVWGGVTHGPAGAGGACLTEGLNTGSGWSAQINSTWGGTFQAPNHNAPVSTCEGFSNSTILSCPNWTCSPLGNGTNHHAGFQQWTYFTANYGWSTSYLAGARVTMNDGESPSIAPIPDATANAPTDQFTIASSDNGLGVNHVWTSSPTDPGWAGEDRIFPCFGTAWSPCPMVPTPGQPQYGELAHGPQQIQVVAWDPLAKGVVRTFNVNVNYYWASWKYDLNGDHASNTDDEVDALVHAFATTSNSDRLWAGLSPSDRSVLTEALVDPSSQTRDAYGLTASDSTVRSRLAVPSYLKTVEPYGAPMTPGELDAIDPTSAPTSEADSPDTDGAASAASVNSWFNRARTVSWADSHVEDETNGGVNSLFRPLPNDCTNWVAQAWYIGGGLHMTKNWHMRIVPHGKNSTPSHRTWTNSWGVADSFAQYMVNTRKIASFRTATGSAAHSGGVRGDVIEYDWGTGDGWSHVSLLVSTNGSIDEIDQHSHMRNHGSWKRGWDDATPAAKANYRARVVHVNHK